MTGLHAGNLAIHLTPGDARTTRSAGVDYARTLTGAPTDAFLEALAEQENLIVRWTTGAGFSTDLAQAMAREFVTAAETEWRRIAGACGSLPGGRA